MSNPTEVDTEAPAAQPEVAAKTKPRGLKAWQRFMKWYFGLWLLLGTPVVWVLAVLSYLGRIECGVMGEPVKRLPDLLLTALTGPLAVLIIGLILWAILVLPLQLLWWGIRSGVRAWTQR